MDSPSNLFFDPMILAFFVNGLAFFMMGLAITLVAQKPTNFMLEKSLWLLTVYALLRALANWMQMFWLIENHATSVHDNYPLQFLNALVLPIATLFLFQFAIKSIIAANPRYLWLRWVFRALPSLWLLIFIHALLSPSVTSTESLLAADVWGRYLLYLPGLFLSSIALFTYARVLRGMKFPHIAGDCIGAGAFFGLKAIFCGLIVSPSPFFLSSFLNDSSFLALVGMPVQLFRMISTLAITYFMVRILKVFQIEQRGQIELATQQRLQAQQEALETQRKAHEEIESWNKQLGHMFNTIATIAIAISDELSRIDTRNFAREKPEGSCLPSPKGDVRLEGGPRQPLGLEEMLGVVLRKVLEVTGFEAGNVFTVNAQGKEPTLIAYHGPPECILNHEEMINLVEERLARATESGEFIVEDEVIEDPASTGRPANERLWFRVSLLLKFKNKVQGIMNLAGKNHHLLTSQEMTLLNAIGQQIGVAIQGVRLYDRVQNVAVLEERDRIGRELHDGLAQVLGYLHLKSKALEGLLEGVPCSEGASQALAELHEMQQVSRDAYRDVRESILGLRTTITRDRGLIPTLREYLHLFSHQCAIRAELATRAVTMEFQPDVEIQLLRIVQEALTNVRKHSQASRVWVRFEGERDNQVLIVEDDGRGFDLSRIGQDHQQRFGLQTMRERAEGVGGDLKISTHPGQGTKVIVKIPLSRIRSE